MKIYVATKWEEKARARQVMNDLEWKGHEITHDWTTWEQESSGAAEGDITGVVNADALLLICEKDLPYANMLVEFGAALGTGKPVYVMGNAPVTKLLMFQHPLVLFIRSLDDIR